MTAGIRITADDAGVLPSIDNAVLALLAMGTLTRAAVFCNGPGFANFARLTRDQYSVVPHLTLTYGCPLGDPTKLSGLLAETGNFVQPLDFYAGDIQAAITSWFRSAFRSCDLEATGVEVVRQVDHFCAAYGERPEATTFHHDIDELILDGPFDSLPECFRLGRAGALRSKQYAGATYAFLATGATLTDAISTAGTMIEAAIDLSETQGGLPAEAIFHPSVSETELSHFTAYGAGRVLEYEALQSSEVRNLLRRATREGDLLVFG